MDIQAEDIIQRLTATLSLGAKLLLWEDEAGEYRDAIKGLAVPGATIIDVTGAELASKRTVYRERPDERFVLYRAGGAPPAQDDLIYDLKQMAVPFTVEMEGLWASECGVSPLLATVLARHAAFFNSKERKERLAKSSLPKTGPEELELAMCAAALLVREGTPRDVARDMAKRALFEWQRNKEESMRLLTEASLDGAFWAAMANELGYRVPDGATPSVEDLAYRICQGTLGRTVEDRFAMNAGEAVRIMSDLSAPRHRDVLEAMVERCGEMAASQADLEGAELQELLRLDGLPQVDEAILGRFASAASTSAMDMAALEDACALRRHGIWGERFSAYYESLLALGKLGVACASYKQAAPSATSLADIVQRYSEEWYLVDSHYRALIEAWHRVPAGHFKDSLSGAVAKAEADYGSYLSDIANRWQAHVLDNGVWPPEVDSAQTSFFMRYVLRQVPEAAQGKRIGIVVSDALRFEMGEELASRIAQNVRRAKTSIEPALSTIPSYTQLGMAALLPDGPMMIEPDTNVTKGGKPTGGTANREKLMAERLAGARALRAKDVLAQGSISEPGAPVIVVYHNVIDFVGDKRDTETNVFPETRRAFAEVETLTGMLLAAGCGKVYITADHGFIYQDHDPEPHEYADVPGLSILKSSDAVDSEHTRRFIVGDAIPSSDVLIEYTPEQLSLVGDYKIAVPMGITRLRLSGSGARFVHGGASPQENIIPVICVEQVKGKDAAHPVDVDGFPTGRASITGPTVMVDVYQTEPLSENVTASVAIVGLYAKDGTLLSSTEQTLTLESTSMSSEDRKTRVVLDLTDDVDKHQSAFLRISTRVGNTNATKVAWEREYSVNRAFGRDF